jgi:hypothetical protein
MGTVTLETTEGVMLSIEAYNDLQLKAQLLEELLTPDQFGEGAIDYPTEHPDRCKKLDNTYYDPPIMENGKSRLHWRCHKKSGHIGWCSSHNDCGANVWSDELGAMATCGKSPGHDNGVHNV